MASDYVVIIISNYDSFGNETNHVQITKFREGINLYGNPSIVLYTAISLELSNKFCEDFIELKNDMIKLCESYPTRFDDEAEYESGNIERKLQELSSFILTKV